MKLPAKKPNKTAPHPQPGKARHGAAIRETEGTRRPEEQPRRLLERADGPCRLFCGELVLNLRFTEGGPTLDRAVEDYLLALKRG